MLACTDLQRVGDLQQPVAVGVSLAPSEGTEGAGYAGLQVRGYDGESVDMV